MTKSTGYIKTKNRWVLPKAISTVLASLPVLFSTMTNAAEYFVAPAGVDDLATNNGSIAQPWGSLNFALSQITAGDTVSIRGGTYHEVVTKGNLQGTATQPIVIQAYNGEAVTFDGTIPITGSWDHHSGNIYKLSLAEPIWQLFVGNEMMMNARWPDARFDDGSAYTRESWAKGLDATSTNGFIDTDPSVHDLAAENIDVTGAVVIANTRHFNSYTRAVTSHSAGSNAFNHDVTPFFWGTESYYYLQGALSLLSQNKEWHIDKTNNTLYFWAPDGNIPSGNIRGRNQQFAIDANNWNHVTIKGLNFFATTVELTASESITIEDSNFDYSGISKRALGETDAKASLLRLTNNVNQGNFILRNIAVRHSDSQAFVIKGNNSVVENSLFEFIDWSATESYLTSSTLVFAGSNNRLTRNTIHTTGTSETVASVGSLVMDYNQIYNTGFAQSDGALIQVRVDAQDGSALHHNWLHDTPKYGYRFDAPIPPPSWGNNGYSHHNVVWNSKGANLKSTSARHFNNLLFDNDYVDLIILDEVAQNGDQSNLTTRTINNASDSISGHRIDPAAIPGTVTSNFNGLSESVSLKSQLRDPDNYDFRPAASSVLIDAGEEINDSDFSHVAIGAAPDQGAYELGANDYWIPGRLETQTSMPIPHHLGQTAQADADLIWREAYQATSYDVYFGTASDALVFQGNQSNNIFSPGALTVGSEYFWRVDAQTPTGVEAGNVWRFTVAEAEAVATVTSLGDAYVDDTTPSSNYGAAGSMKLTTPSAPGGAYQQRFGFVKFDVDVPGTVTSAKLRLYNNTGSKNRFVNVHQMSDTSWDEMAINWNNQPVIGGSLAEQDVLANSWSEFDVTTAVQTNGLISFAIKRGVDDSRRDIATKESGYAPELVLTYQPGAVNTPPVFNTDPITATNGIENSGYSDSIGAYASDADGDTLSFTKLLGPNWLVVSADGSLSGTPQASDIGTNSFVVQVADGKGGTATAQLNVEVEAMPVPRDDLFVDDMEDGSMSGWTRQNKVSAISAAAYNSNYGARLKQVSSMEQAVDTTGYHSIRFEYVRRTNLMDAGEYLSIEWYDGSNWLQLEQTSDSNWASMAFDLPAGADNNAAVKIRFTTLASEDKENGEVDNIRVSGVAN